MWGTYEPSIDDIVRFAVLKLKMISAECQQKLILHATFNRRSRAIWKKCAMVFSIGTRSQNLLHYPVHCKIYQDGQGKQSCRSHLCIWTEVKSVKPSAWGMMPWVFKWCEEKWCKHYHVTRHYCSLGNAVQLYLLKWCRITRILPNIVQSVLLPLHMALPSLMKKYISWPKPSPQLADQERPIYHIYCQAPNTPTTYRSIFLIWNQRWPHSEFRSCAYLFWYAW
jgi:hypothetical protein